MKNEKAILLRCYKRFSSHLFAYAARQRFINTDHLPKTTLHLVGMV
jgi:hypothetical protein